MYLEKFQLEVECRQKGVSGMRLVRNLRDKGMPYLEHTVPRRKHIQVREFC